VIGLRSTAWNPSPALAIRNPNVTAKLGGANVQTMAIHRMAVAGEFPAFNSFSYAPRLSPEQSSESARSTRRKNADGHLIFRPGMRQIEV
jgi:hypothetical protein